MGETIEYRKTNGLNILCVQLMFRKHIGIAVYQILDQT